MEDTMSDRVFLIPSKLSSVLVAATIFVLPIRGALGCDGRNPDPYLPCSGPGITPGGEIILETEDYSIRKRSAGGFNPECYPIKGVYVLEFVRKDPDNPFRLPDKVCYVDG
jgi:hypothetical protein